MACKVFAPVGGWQFLAPDTRMVFVERESTILWQWPVVPEGHPDYDPDHTLPRSWRVVEELGQSGLSEALAEERAARESAHDPYAERATPMGEKKANALSRDQEEMIRAAVGELEPGDTDHFTGRGPTAKPRVNVVQEIVERMGKEDTGERIWPEWVTRRSIDHATADGLVSED